MRNFAALFESLDTTTATGDKVAAMARYFGRADPGDAAWAVYVLMGRRLKRTLGPALLKTWLHEECSLPAWLIDETYALVGDLAETIALLVESSEADTTAADVPLQQWFTERLLPLQGRSDVEQRASVVGWWRSLPYRENFLVNKLLTGSLRVGVSRSLVTRALQEALQRDRVEIERALMGEWHPDAAFWLRLQSGEVTGDIEAPYPFYLASPLEAPVESLGARADWLAEWKWDGIRAQLVRRGGRCALWSRGEEIVTDRFPEIVSAGSGLPDGTVIDGEILAWSGDGVLPFSQMQRRIGRTKLTARVLAEAPVRLIAYDLLERDGQDWRPRPLSERRDALAALLADAPAALGMSAGLTEADWTALAAARERSRSLGVEGLMLKRLDSPYGIGRQRGQWWKWKVDPFVFDGVLLYAQPGHGRRSNLYTDYTFAVWHEGALVPVAKAYSGLTNAEIATLDKWIRGHTLEKFGPVRSVEPVQVFELAYENIAASTRHKSGIAVRFPRIHRWRTDKPASEADTLANLRQVLAGQRAHEH